MQNITFQLRKMKTSKKGTILIAIPTSSGRIRYSTGLKIDQKKWYNGFPLPNQTVTIGKLIELKEIMETFLNETENATKDKIKEIIKRWKNGKSILIDFNEGKKITDIIDDYLNYKKSEVRESTFKGIKLHLTLLQEFCRDKTIDELDRNMVIAFLNRQQKERKLSEGGFNKYRKNIIAFTNWLHRKNHIKKPITIKRKTEKKKQITPLYDEELDILWNASDGGNNLTKREVQVVNLFLLCAYTGLRKSDAFLLQSDNVDFTQNLMKITHLKTNIYVEVPLVDRAKAILKKYDCSIPKISNPSKVLKTASRKLKLNREIFVQSLNQKKKLHKIIRTHCGRQTFCTRAIRNGLSAEETMQYSGHTTYESFKCYIEFCKNDYDRAYKTLNV